jgi:uncharacterized membrane-anchored protein
MTRKLFPAVQAACTAEAEAARTGPIVITSTQKFTFRLPDGGTFTISREGDALLVRAQGAEGKSARIDWDTDAADQGSLKLE